MSRLIARYGFSYSHAKLVILACIAFLLVLVTLGAVDAMREQGKAGVDSDGDGLSDADELNLHATNPNAADTDGDTMRDGDEIIAGTDPRSAASVFRLLAPPENIGVGWRIQWTSIPGKTYQVERVTLVSGAATNWTQIGEVTAAGGVSSFTDTNAAGQRYYRVRVQGVLITAPGVFTPLPDFFLPLGGAGQPVEGSPLQLNPDGSLPAFEFRPGGASSLGAGQGFHVRFPSGARVVTNSGVLMIQFSSASLGFGPRSPFQLAGAIGVSNGVERLLPVGDIEVAALLAAFGLPATNGLDVTLFGKFPLKIMAGTFTDEGLRGARVTLMDSSLPLPGGNHVYANFTLEFEPDGSVRIPFSGGFKLSDGTDNSAELFVPPARPLWLELRADGGIGLGGRAELKFNPGPEFSVDFLLDDPLYELAMSARGLHLPLLSGLSDIFPDVPEVANTVDPVLLAQSTEKLRHYNSAVAEFGAVARADTPLGEDDPPDSPPVIETGPASMLNAWGYAALSSSSLDPASLSNAVAHAGKAAAAAANIQTALDLRLALLRVKLAFAQGGLAPHPTVQAQLDEAVEEVTAAIILRAQQPSAVQGITTFNAVVRSMLLQTQLQQQLALAENSDLTAALQALLQGFTSDFTQQLQVSPGTFGPAAGSPIAAMSRAETSLTLTQTVVIVRTAQQLGLDSAITAPLPETVGQLSSRLWQLASADLNAAEAAADYAAFLNALRPALELIALVQSGIVPDPALPNVPDETDLDDLSARLGAVFQAQLDREADLPDEEEAESSQAPGAAKIVGGTEAPAPIPYQAAIVTTPFREDMFSQHFCGGTILNKDWILTAAHCVEELTDSTLAVLIGVRDLSLLTEEDGYSEEKNYYEVDRKLVHPMRRSGSPEYDIALLKLKRPINFSLLNESALTARAITPLSAAKGVAGVPALNSIARVSGWGRILEGAQRSPQLLFTDVRISNNGSYAPGTITSRMLPAVDNDEDPSGTCQGDSGGPLVITHRGVALQGGVVSFANGCARPEYPTVYTRVSRFEPWIRTEAGMKNAQRATLGNLRKTAATIEELAGVCRGISSTPNVLPAATRNMIRLRYDRAEALLAVASRNMGNRGLRELLASIRLGAALGELRDYWNFDTPHWWESGGAVGDTVLGQFALAAKQRSGGTAEGTDLSDTMDVLLAQADRLGAAGRQQDRRNYLEAAKLLVEASRASAEGAYNTYLQRINGGSLRKNAGAESVVDMLLPGDLYIDRVAGSVRYNRKTEFLEGVFSGQLRLPKFDLSLTIDNTRLNSGGAFDLNAYGQLGLGAPDTQLGTLSVPQRRPLQISFRPPNDLRFDGSARLALQNGMALESFLRLDDPIYEFGLLAEGLRFDLSRRLPQHLPIIPTGLTFETAGVVHEMLSSMAGALSQSTRDASPLPSTPGAPPEFVSIPPPQDVESLQAVAGLRRARAALNTAGGTEALDELLAAQLTAMAGAMTQGLEPLEAPEKTAARAGALLELVSAASPSAAAGAMRKNESIIPEYREAALKLRASVLAQLNEAANRTEIARAIKTLQAAMHYEELRVRSNDPEMGSIDTLLPAFIEEARANYYSRVGLNPVNGSIADTNLFRNYHPPNHEAILARISLLAQTAQNVFGDENPFDLQLFKDTVSTVRIQQRHYWVELFRKTPADHFERRLEILTELNRLVTDAYNGKFDYVGPMRRIDGSDGPLQPIDDAEALQPFYLEAFNRLAAENKTGLLRPFLRGLRLTRVTFQREYPPDLVASLNNEVRAELQRFSAPQPSPQKNGSAKAGAQLEELRQPDLALDYVLELSRWAELEGLADAEQLRSGALDGLMSSVQTQAEQEGAWWKLTACHALLIAVGENTNDPPSSALRSALTETLEAGFPVLRAIIDDLATAANALPIPDFRLPGNIEVPRAFGRLFYNRETGYLQGQFGGRMEIPDLENAHFEITEATLDNHLSFSIAANTSGPLPIGGVRLSASVTASGGTNQPFDFHGTGTMILTNGPDVAVDLAFNTGTRTLSLDTAITDLESWRLTDDLVLFDAGFGFTLSAAQQFGELRARGTAGLFAKGNLPTNQPLSQTNFHLYIDDLTAAVQLQPDQIRLAFSNGTLHLPAFFYPTNMAALCPGTTGSPTGPTIALNPGRPIEATVRLAFPPAQPGVDFSGELDFRHFGLAVPGVPGMAAAICSARLLFDNNTLPYLTNVNATLQIPLPRSTNNIDLEDGVFTLTGFPSGRLELRQDLPLLDLSGFKVIVLGQGHAECPQGSGLTVFPSEGFQQLPAFQIDGGLRVEAPAAMLTGVDGDSAYGLACGGIFITNGQWPRLSVDALQFGGTFHLGGADGILLSNALVSLEGIENILNPSQENPFIARLGGTMVVPNGPGFTLSNAMFRFFDPNRLPRFSVDGMGFDLTGFELVQSLPAAIDRAAFAFKDPELELPYLLSPTNITLSMSAHVSIPPGEDKFIGGRIDNVKMTVTPNGLLEIQSIAGLLLEIGSVSIPPIEEIGGKLYIGGLQNLNPSEMYFVGRVAGSYQGYKLKMMMAFNMAGPIGMCLDVNAGAAGIPLGQTTFLFTGAGGGVSFLNNGQDPCEFTTYVDPEGKPLSSVVGGFPLPNAMSWQNLKSTLARMERTAAAYATGQAQAARTQAKELALMANGFDCPGGCPPPTVNIFCQPHPDAALYPNRVIMKFTSISESTLNDVFHITPENMNTLGGNAVQVATNFARRVRVFVETNIPPFDAAFPGDANAIRAAVSETLDAMESTFSTTLHLALSNVPPSSFYGVIRDLAYVGAPCPDITMKVFGTFSQAAVSSFLSATVGGQITSAGNAGLFGNINALGIPIGKGKIFVAATDDRGLPNPSVCGEIELAFGPLELGLMRGEMSCRDCVTGILREFYKLAQCLSEPVIRQLASNAAPRLAAFNLPVEQLLNQMTNVEKIGFMAEVYQLPPGVIASLPQCFITQFRQAIDVFQPYLVLCGVVEPKIFGLPLGGRLIEASAEVSKTNIAALTSYSPSQLLAWAYAFTGVGRQLFPFEDRATFGFNVSYPDPGVAVLAGLEGKLSSSNAVADYAAQQFDYMLQNATYVTQFELKPLGGQGLDTQARVVMPNFTNHPARPGSTWNFPELARPDLLSREDLLLLLLEQDKLVDPFWTGENLGDAHPSLAGLNLRKDYFPHGGYLGAARIAMPRALTETPPDYLPGLLNPDSSMPPLDRLLNAIDYAQNYLFSFTNRGSLAFYVPAPNPPFFTNSSGQNLGPREMLEAIGSFDFRSITNAQVASLYPFHAGFLKGYFNATLLGVPMATGMVVALPPAPTNGRPDAVMRLEVAATPQGWMSHFVTTNNIIVEMRGAPPRPIEAWANQAVLELAELSVNPDNLSQQAFENLIRQRVGEFAESFTTNLPKMRLEADLQFQMPPPISDIFDMRNRTILHAYSPKYDPAYQPQNDGPLARIQREGGIAFEGSARLKVGSLTLVDIDTAEFSLIPRGEGLPEIAARLRADTIPFPPDYPITTVRDVNIDLATAPRPYFRGSGRLDLFAFGDFALVGSDGAQFGGSFEVSSRGNGQADVSLSINPANLVLGLYGERLLVHGATRNDPFTFSTTGPWSASLEVTNDLNLLNLIEVGYGGLFTPITLAGYGTNASFSVGFGPGAGLTLLPAHPSLRRDITLGAGAAGSLAISNNGRFRMTAALGGTAFSFNNISIPAGATLTASNEGVSITWFVNQANSTTVSFGTNGQVAFNGQTELPSLNFGVFQISGADGGNLRGSFNNDGFAVESGARLKLNGDWLGHQVLTLASFTYSNNGGIHLSATSQSGGLVFAGYPFQPTALTFTRTATNQGNVATLAVSARVEAQPNFIGLPPLVLTGAVSSAGSVFLQSSAGGANFFGFPVVNYTNTFAQAAGDYLASYRTDFVLGDGSAPFWDDVPNYRFSGQLNSDGSFNLAANTSALTLAGFPLGEASFILSRTVGGVAAAHLEGNFTPAGWNAVRLAGGVANNGAFSLGVAAPVPAQPLPYPFLNSGVSLLLSNNGMFASGLLNQAPLPSVSLTGAVTTTGSYLLNGRIADSVVAGFQFTNINLTLAGSGLAPGSVAASGALPLPNLATFQVSGGYTNQNRWGLAVTNPGLVSLSALNLPVPQFGAGSVLRWTPDRLSLTGQVSGGALGTIGVASAQAALHIEPGPVYTLSGSFTFPALTNGQFVVQALGGGNLTGQFDNTGVLVSGAELRYRGNTVAALPAFSIQTNSDFTVTVGAPEPIDLTLEDFGVSNASFVLRRTGAILSVGNFNGELTVPTLGSVTAVSGSWSNNGNFTLTGSLNAPALLNGLPVAGLAAGAAVSLNQSGNITLNGTFTGSIFNHVPELSASGQVTVTSAGAVTLSGNANLRAPFVLGAFRIQPQSGGTNMLATWNNNGLSIHVINNMRLLYNGVALANASLPSVNISANGDFTFTVGALPNPVSLSLGGFTIGNGSFVAQRSSGVMSVSVTNGSLAVPGLNSPLNVSVTGTLASDGSYVLTSTANTATSVGFGSPLLVNLAANASTRLEDDVITLNGSFFGGISNQVAVVGSMNGSLRIVMNGVVPQVTPSATVTIQPFDFGAFDIRPTTGGNFVCALGTNGLTLPNTAQLLFNNVPLGGFLLPQITVAANGSFTGTVSGANCSIGGFSVNGSSFNFARSGSTFSISSFQGSLGIPGWQSAFSVGVSGSLNSSGTYSLSGTNNVQVSYGSPTIIRLNTGASITLNNGAVVITGSLSAGVLSFLPGNPTASGIVTVYPDGRVVPFAQVIHDALDFGAFDIRPVPPATTFTSQLGPNGLTLPSAARLYLNNVALGSFDLPNLTIPGSGDFFGTVGPVSVTLNNYNLGSASLTYRKQGNALSIPQFSATLAIPQVNGGSGASAGVGGSFDSAGNFLITNSASVSFMTLPGLPVTSLNANSRLRFSNVSGVTLGGDLTGGILTTVPWSGSATGLITIPPVGTLLSIAGTMTLNPIVFGGITIEATGGGNMSATWSSAGLSLTGFRVSAPLMFGSGSGNAVTFGPVTIPASGNFSRSLTAGITRSIVTYPCTGIFMTVNRTASPASISISGISAQLNAGPFNQTLSGSITTVSGGSPAVALDYSGSISLSGFSSSGGLLRLRNSGLSGSANFNVVCAGRTLRSGFTFSGAVDAIGGYNWRGTNSLNLGGYNTLSTAFELDAIGVYGNSTLTYGDGSGHIEAGAFIDARSSGVTFNGSAGSDTGWRFVSEPGIYGRLVWTVSLSNSNPQGDYNVGLDAWAYGWNSNFGSRPDNVNDVPSCQRAHIGGSVGNSGDVNASISSCVNWPGFSNFNFNLW